MAIKSQFQVFVKMSVCFLIVACNEENNTTPESASSSTLTANQAGVAGPQGPAGPQGATGPQGPMGPAGSFQAFERPMPFNDTARNSLLTVDGWLNNTGRFVVINGVIQFSGILNGCKSASLEIKWDAGSAWVTYQHFYHESQVADGPGDGGRYNATATLPPGGRIRVVENSNTDCQMGVLYLGASDGQRDAPWFYTVAR